MAVTTYPSPTLYQDLRDLEYTGAFNDMFNKWLDDSGYGPGSLTDKIALFKGVGKPWRFATNRVRMPAIQVQTTVAASVYSFTSRRLYTPGYDQTDLRVCFPNFATPAIGGTGTPDPFEVPLDAGRIIEGAYVMIDGVRHPLTFGGSATHTFGADPYVWSDPLEGVTLPANSYIDVALADYTPLGLRRPRNYDPAGGKYGDAWAQGSTTQSGYLTSGAPSAPTFGATAMGPCAVVARGAPASQPVPLVIGMSITSGTGNNITSQLGRGNLGFLEAGLDDDTSGVGRFAFGMFAVGSTNFLSLTASQFAIRKQLLADVGYPFTSIYCGHGQNDVGLGLVAMKAAADAGWAFLKTMGGKRLIQGGMNPLTGDSNNDKWSVPATQTTASENTKPSGARWQFHDYVKTLPANVDDYIDETPYYVDATYTDRWAAMGRNSVLAEDVSSGTTISVSGTPPIPGDAIVIGAGASGAITRNVGDVTGTGPYTVTFSTGQSAIATSFLAGAVVRATPTTDGIHPSGPMHSNLSTAIIAAKAAGVFV